MHTLTPLVWRTHQAVLHVAALMQQKVEIELVHTCLNQCRMAVACALSSPRHDVFFTSQRQSSSGAASSITLAVLTRSATHYMLRAVTLSKQCQ
jgi:hypothetical protein